MEHNWPAGLGLSVQSSNEEIRDKVFSLLLDIGTLTVATIAIDGVSPTVRALEIHRLDEQGNLYIGVSHGKPVYQELLKNPRVSGGAVQLTRGRLGMGVRISALLEEVCDGEIFSRYWRQNPGTAALYRRDPGNFCLFRLAKGDGEIFDLCEDDQTLRFRFGFGGGTPRPWRYTVNNRCTGCGLCVESCMKSVLRLEKGRAVIDHNGCLECGRCFDACPNGAVSVSGA